MLIGLGNNHVKIDTRNDLKTGICREGDRIFVIS
jgi:hypothetical protein